MVSWVARSSTCAPPPKAMTRGREQVFARWMPQRPVKPKASAQRWMKRITCWGSPVTSSRIHSVVPPCSGWIDSRKPSAGHLVPRGFLSEGLVELEGARCVVGRADIEHAQEVREEISHVGLQKWKSSAHGRALVFR
jgi:hypothetical protein